MGFGRRVLGEEAWQAQEKAAKAKRATSGFGVRVTGPVEPEVEEQAPVKKQAPVNDPDVPSKEAPGAPEKSAPLSLVELKKALAGNDSIVFFDQLTDAEFERVEGPRKGGLRLLLKAEQDREEARPAIVTQLTQALKA